jgi:hypothetical protein
MRAARASTCSKRGGAERVAGVFAAQVAARHAAQLVVEALEQR